MFLEGSRRDDRYCNHQGGCFAYENVHLRLWLRLYFQWSHWQEWNWSLQYSSPINWLDQLENPTYGRKRLPWKMRALCLMLMAQRWGVTNTATWKSLWGNLIKRERTRGEEEKGGSWLSSYSKMLWSSQGVPYRMQESHKSGHFRLVRPICRS